MHGNQGAVEIDSDASEVLSAGRRDFSTSFDFAPSEPTSLPIKKRTQLLLSSKRDLVDLPKHQLAVVVYEPLPLLLHQQIFTASINCHKTLHTTSSRLPCKTRSRSENVTGGDEPDSLTTSMIDLISSSLLGSYALTPSLCLKYPSNRFTTHTCPMTPRR